MRKSLTILLATLLAGLTAGLSVHAESKPAGKVNVIVGILPVAYFVQRVGGANVNVHVLVGPGQDPHTFEPTPRQVANLAEAQVLFKMGFPFEENLIKKVGSTFKNLKVVDLQQGIIMRPVAEEEAAVEEAENGAGDKDEQRYGVGEAAEEHEHSHEAGDMDPHTWLNPRLAKIQAGTIADALIRIDPSHRKDYEKNLKGFQADLDTVDNRLAQALAPVKGKSFLVFHPAYGYFGDAYGLRQIPVQLSGKEPSARQLARLIDIARKDGLRVIFVQPQFSQKSAEALAGAIGGAAVPMDDLARDYLNNLQEMAKKLDSALRAQGK